MEKRILSTDEATPGVLASVLGDQYMRGMNILERAQQRALKVFKALEHLSCEESLRDLGVSAWRREDSGGS